MAGMTTIALVSEGETSSGSTDCDETDGNPAAPVEYAAIEEPEGPPKSAYTALISTGPQRPVHVKAARPTHLPSSTLQAAVYHRHAARKR